MTHNPPLPGQRLTAKRLDDLDTQGTYTPALTATGGNPVLGADGFINGRWHRNGHMITAWGDTLLDGSGASLGGSSWRVTLPFDANTSFHPTGVLNSTGDCIGIAKWRSSISAESYVSAALLSDTAELIFYRDGSSGSEGANDLTLPVRLKWTATYVAEPTGLPHTPKRSLSLMPHIVPRPGRLIHAAA